jgi:hypothetical protein
MMGTAGSTFGPRFTSGATLISGYPRMDSQEVEISNIPLWRYTS